VKKELHANNMKQYDDDYDVYKYLSFYIPGNGIISSIICSMIKPNGMF
jgi:hypothetical protein